MKFRNISVKIYIINLLIIAQYSLLSQNLLYPLSIEPTLAGNYAELRRNHFHMGLDFKTDNKENLPIIAVESGYVSRVLISPNGYGKALYINHPLLNLTTVYAHLNSFDPKLQAWVDKTQYALQKNTLDTTFLPNLFPITKGQLIALIGNTGGSDGPHLHFEIRNMTTEKSLNPLLFYPKMEDSFAPIITKILFYKLGNNSEFIQAYSPTQTRNKTLELKADKIGIAVSASDKINNSENSLGIYALRIYENNRLIYQFKLDSLDFSWGSHIKAISDYDQPYSDIYKGFYEKCGFNLTDIESKNGVIFFKVNELKNIKIEVYDAAGNSSQEEFNIKNIPSLGFTTSYSFPVNCDEEFISTDPELYTLIIPKKGLAEDIEGMFKSSTKLGVNELLNLNFLNQNTAVLKPYQLLYLGNYDEPKKSKIYLESTADNKHKAYIGSWNGKQIIFPKLKNFGNLIVKYDLKPPTISPKPIKTNETLIFTVSDLESEIGSYRLTFDGQWRKLYYDEKNNQLIYSIISTDKGKKVKALIEVMDRVGNKNLKSFEIFL
jgi:hypothetical protein